MLAFFGFVALLRIGRCLVIIAPLLTAAACPVSAADSPDDLQIRELYDAGRYRDAVQLADRVLVAGPGALVAPQAGGGARRRERGARGPVEQLLCLPHPRRREVLPRRQQRRDRGRDVRAGAES